jgi:hypothetical protein
MAAAAAIAQVPTTYVQALARPISATSQHPLLHRRAKTVMSAETMGKRHVAPNAEKAIILPHSPM